MKPTSTRHHRSRRQSEAAVSLFPFLAVLICTMGALIVLLVVLARQARLQAAQASRAAIAESAAKSTANKEKLKVALEDVQWRIEQMEYSRDATAKQLEEARLQLGHIEDHARRLRDKLLKLQAEYDRLQTFDRQENRRTDELRGELSKLEAQIAEARATLAEAERAAAQRKRSYAVVPYKGPYQTHRRPIYIECRRDAIILQPEGIELSEEDFLGPTGPGNPLAAALRSAREYLLVNDGIDPNQKPGDADSPEMSAEPYPLLLVRPDGIMAYYVARAAMSSWSSDFGYELIGDDWKLDFHDPDPRLAQVEAKAVHTARARQARLAAAAPSHYQGAPRREYRAAPGRGGAVLDPGSVGVEDRGYQPRRPGRAMGSRFGNPPGTAGAPGDLPPDAADSPGSPFVGRPAHEQPSDTAAAHGAPRRPGEWRPPVDKSAAGLTQTNPSGRSPSERVNPLAKTRGKNWGLPDATDSSVGITRPIRIDCHADSLEIVAVGDPQGNRTIRLGPNTEDSIDELVSKIWNHMESWGIAGNGMYWKPVLSFHVDPDATHRFDELETLLDGSGMTVTRKEVF